MNYDNYYNEIVDDIRAEFGDSAISKPSQNSLDEWKAAIHAYKNATPEQLAQIEKIRKERYGF